MPHSKNSFLLAGLLISLFSTSAFAAADGTYECRGTPVGEDVKVGPDAPLTLKGEVHADHRLANVEVVSNRKGESVYGERHGSCMTTAGYVGKAYFALAVGLSPDVPNYYVIEATRGKPTPGPQPQPGQGEILNYAGTMVWDMGFQKFTMPVKCVVRMGPEKEEE